MKTKHVDRESTHKKNIAAFIDGWDWDRLYKCWLSRIQDFNIKVDSLFKEILVHDPKAPTGRAEEWAWWPADSVVEEHRNCQRHFDTYPGTRGPTHGLDHSEAGKAKTLNLLWANRDNPEALAAILISGSIFPHYGSARGHYPEGWPPIPAIAVIQGWAYERIEPDKVCPWHYSCTTVIPSGRFDLFKMGQKFDSIESFVRHLAEDHASLLLKNQLIQVNFGPTRDPFIEKFLHSEYEAELQRRLEWERSSQAEKIQAEKDLAAMREKHPRYGEWTRLTRVEFETLVWTKPAIQIAEEFGVSDVAVGKRCKSQMISKPTPGFWNKVMAGKIPHPNGKPV